MQLSKNKTLLQLLNYNIFVQKGFPMTIGIQLTNAFLTQGIPNGARIGAIAGKQQTTGHRKVNTGNLCKGLVN